MRFILSLFLFCCLASGCSTAKSRAAVARRDINSALAGYGAKHHGHFPRTFAELQAYAAPIKPLDTTPFTHFEYRYESPDSVYIYMTP